MINAAMPWRLLFLAATAVFVTAKIPTGEASSSNPENCVVLDSSSDILGITSYSDVLLAANASHLAVFAVKGGKCTRTDTLLLPNSIDRLTEFKFLNETTFVYCSTHTCNHCSLEGRCSELELQQRQEEISQAAATLSTDGTRIFLRAVYAGSQTVIIAYNGKKTKKGQMEAVASYSDPKFLHFQQVAHGFNFEGNSFFVISASQPFEPSALDSSSRGPKGGETPTIKIMRICDRDRTERLESRVDLQLECAGRDKTTTDSTNHKGVMAATFSAETKTVYVTFNSESSDDFVCSYSIDTINKKIDSYWNICQNTTHREAEMCKSTSEGSRPEHCLIMARSGSSTVQPCSRFGNTLANDDKPVYDICELAELASSSYRYSHLEAYIPLEGVAVARISNRGQKYAQMYVDEHNSAIFLAGEDRVFRIRAFFDGDKNALKSLPKQRLYHFSPNSRFALAHLTDDSFLLINFTKVVLYKISCAGVYQDCAALASGGFNDPMKCMYCGAGGLTERGEVISVIDKNSCKMPLYKTCPPVIETYDSSSDGIIYELKGSQLQSTLKSPEIRICGSICTINQAKSTENLLVCSRGGFFVRDSSCSVQLSGELESHKNFTVYPIYAEKGTQTPNPVPVLDSRLAQSSGMSRTWKIVIGIVAIVLIIAIIILIILCARKYLGLRNQKGNGSLGVPFETINSYPRNAARNTYLSTDPSGMPFANNMSPTHAPPAYERLFREIDDRLKIPSDHLLLEKQIGKGHFGVVLKGTYTIPGGPTRAVACKTLSGHVSGGISEFVNEGLMMDRFNHPRVMNLVGISFNEERMPILVTEYMENGDLAKYLRDVNNKPTLRDLLNFTHEIAQGMEYLHDNKFIHRDLAARNCMLDRNLHVKVADFGLCREATAQDEYLPVHQGREMPLRWMSPEALEREQFTMAGDVWAFGVVIWEVMTRGMNPYPNLQAYVLFEFLKAGKRMGKPDFCPDILYRVMWDCWQGEPTMRPTFRELPGQIDDIIDVLSNNARTQMNAEYEQCNSVRNSRAASNSAPTPVTPVTPVTHHTISNMHSNPPEDAPEPTPV